MPENLAELALETGFNAQLGLAFTAAQGDLVTGTVTITPDHHQPFGIVHGGVHASVIETVCSVGAAIWFGERGHVVGVSNTTHFVRAVREGVLSVRATPIQQGRTQQLWTVDIRDEADKLVATGQVRLANIADTAVLGG